MKAFLVSLAEVWEGRGWESATEKKPQSQPLSFRVVRRPLRSERVERQWKLTTGRIFFPSLPLPIILFVVLRTMLPSPLIELRFECAEPGASFVELLRFRSLLGVVCVVGTVRIWLLDVEVDSPLMLPFFDDERLFVSS